MARHFLRLLESLLSDPSARIATAEMLEAAEQRLVDLAGGRAGFPGGVPARALRGPAGRAGAPDALAVTARPRPDVRASSTRAPTGSRTRCARSASGPTRSSACASSARSSVVVALLGILKAGGAYVPLDPDYPRDRLAFMLEDAARRARADAGRRLAAGVPAAGGARRRALDADARRDRRAAHDRAAAARARPSDLAYVIYTSGSTGPAQGRRWSRTATSRGCSTATDALVRLRRRRRVDAVPLVRVRLLGLGAVGRARSTAAALVVVPYWVSRSPDDFHELLARRGRHRAQPDAVGVPPARARRRGGRRGAAARSPALGHLRRRGARRRASSRRGASGTATSAPRLVNMYGITETTVHVTYRPLGRADLERPRRSVIGVPIPDLRCTCSTRDGEPVPVGVAGEIYVGGAGVARGYLDRPELTAERFVPDPFGAAGRAALPDRRPRAAPRRTATSSTSGRIDHQVKIRGFRIELGEIEAALRAAPGRGAAVVVARRGRRRGRPLVAYAGRRREPAPADALRDFLGGRLPEYMVPAPLRALDAAADAPTASSTAARCRAGRRALRAGRASTSRRAPAGRRCWPTSGRRCWGWSGSASRQLLRPGRRLDPQHPGPRRPGSAAGFAAATCSATRPSAPSPCCRGPPGGASRPPPGAVRAWPRTGPRCPTASRTPIRWRASGRHALPWS